MDIFANIDLLTVGIAIAANLTLGFSVFFTNPKSATNRLFFIQTLILSIWSLMNYLSYQQHDPKFALLLVRLVLFFAVPNSVIFLVLMNTFPSNFLKISLKSLLILVTATLIVMGITLSPLLFSSVTVHENSAPTPVVEIGIIPFIILAILSIPLGIYYLIKNYIFAKGKEKQQLRYIFIGVIVMFTLITLFNFIYPTVFKNSRFIPLSAIFTFPFIAFTSYAILKHKLFNIKVAGTALVTFILAVITFAEIIFAEDLSRIIFRSSIFILILVYGINLIRGVLKEVKQREEIQELAKDLEKANVRLKELDQLKTEFISLATHQIRAPLTAIKGYISLMQEGDYGEINSEAKKALDIIFTSTNNLVTIVGDFLDVSRIEQGRMKYEYSDFNLQELIQQVVTEYKPNVDKRGLVLHYTFEENKNYTIHADRGKIKQIIGNIIDNSIKYTPKGEINISLSTKQNKALIKVADTGVGIPQGTMPKLFQKFTRAENANEANILGTGLGLYVAKQMIEAHQGRIWAESEGPNKGSQFYIELQTISNEQKAKPQNTIAELTLPQLQHIK
jgi:signal transduction histidine kinase